MTSYDNCCINIFIVDAYCRPADQLKRSDIALTYNKYQINLQADWTITA